MDADSRVGRGKVSGASPGSGGAGPLVGGAELGEVVAVAVVDPELVVGRLRSEAGEGDVVALGAAAVEQKFAVGPGKVAAVARAVGNRAGSAGKPSRCGRVAELGRRGAGAGVVGDRERDGVEGVALEEDVERAGRNNGREAREVLRKGALGRPEVIIGG
eukprot:CAMPEP_0196667952 /NCGR_PEP_ID=MMETSP1086-20130531/65362_1 /TAXON_ID=77921 /ORGANISM="Cyanoptyche  gloeocystis , Strain SAG4.97" /LENGTH=159 /DNA_ID=CAMNT_0042005325 /DNA_START=877 /DNA_END=1352 /DNA_ORIENTATION=+